MICVKFLQGLWAEINGPTLPDLVYRMNSDYEIVSRAISMRGAGNLAGSILGQSFLLSTTIAEM